MDIQKYIPKFLFKHKKSNYTEEKINFIKNIQGIIEFNVRNPDIYIEAFSLKSNLNSGNKNYERLEFLGDAVLGSIISSYLFLHYPKANEGEMTQLKSKIVNRKNLNKIGEELKLTKFINTGHYSQSLGENIHGNLLEALIGAIFLDTNYDTCRNIVLKKILTPELINKLEHKIGSYKSILLEWANKKKKTLRYETFEEESPYKSVLFRSIIWVDKSKISNATALSKKKAEEKAAQRAFYTLNKTQNILEKTKSIP